jgi:hypothetical protein
MTKTADGDLDAELKVEEDWAGERRVLSISLTAERPKRLVAAAAARERSISALLNHDQWRLIHKCAGIVVNPVALTMLPAMSAMRWPPPPFTVPGPGASALEVRAERWDCQRLGLPRVVDCRRGAGRAGGPGGADRLREGKGLQRSAGEAKTIQVLQRLVTEAAC